MLARTDGAASNVYPALMTFGELKAAAGDGPDDALRWLADWTATYLTKAHDGLGRRGPVCPFTPQAVKIDTLRFAFPSFGPDDGPAAEQFVRHCFDELDRIACPAALEPFRAIVLACPNCRSKAGVEMLKRVQSRLSPLSLRRLRMIGLFYPDHPAKGAWNHEFRPLDAPIPMVVVRQMVEQDAPFATRNLRLLAVYLWKFRLTGLRRLYAYWSGRP